MVNLYGLLLNPQIFTNLLDLSNTSTYKANVLTGWFSPLNHATYYMHNFGYDYLPRLWMSYLIFSILILINIIGIYRRIRNFEFSFVQVLKGAWCGMSVEIRLENVSKSFGEEMVVKNVSHVFEAGKVHGIVGFNGSGKTVLFKCICGLLRPSIGHILVGGKEIGKEVDFPESLGLLIENPGFFPRMTAYQNLKLLASLKGIITDQEVRESILKVGLDPDSKKPVGKYSMGMRERLGIAQAIMENPDLLILDEPFNGLDKKRVQDVYTIILELKKQGKTILLASHNAVDIEKLCDTVCEMDNGTMQKVR